MNHQRALTIRAFEACVSHPVGSPMIGYLTQKHYFFQPPSFWLQQMPRPSRTKPPAMLPWADSQETVKPVPHIRGLRHGTSPPTGPLNASASPYAETCRYRNGFVNHALHEFSIP